MIDWAREIRRFREANGLLQDALAARLGVSQATVSRWESGRQRPDVAGQTQLRALLWGNLVGSEALMLHAVRLLPGMCIVGDEGGRVLAASKAMARLVGLPEPAQHPLGQRLRFDRRAVSPTAEFVYGVAREAGLFEARIASLNYTGRVETAKGPMLSEELWTPLRLDSGEVVARADLSLRPPRDAAELEAVGAQPAPRMMQIEEVLAEAAPQAMRA